ncbi:hypothetical protein A3L14_00435 [Thermococcus thioreducens]|nr:hypothetical protein A3L14_00435 [Thermococcus thioreducens]KQH83460.1 hypothetical protein AMR53_00440 [Thermococcus thioreducens]
MVVSNSFNPDPRVYKEAKSLLDRGYLVRVVAWNRDGTHPPFEVIDGLEVERIGVPARYGVLVEFLLKLPVFYVIFLWKYLRKGREFDVIHTHDFDTALLGFLLKLVTGIHWVYDVHDLYDSLVSNKTLGMLITLFDSLFLRTADAVITVNHEMTRILIKRSRPRHVVVVMNTMNPFNVCREKWSSFTIFYGGVLSNDRFIEEMIEIAYSLGVNMRIAGLGILEDKIKHAPVDFLGYISHKQAVMELSKAHLTFILYDPAVPNNRIASPNKLFEAMWVGTPVIVVKGTLPEKLASKFVVPAQYSREDVKNLLLELKLNPKILRKKARFGRRIFLAKYTWDIMESKLMTLYLEVLK